MATLPFITVTSEPTNVGTGSVVGSYTNIADNSDSGWMTWSSINGNFQSRFYMNAMPTNFVSMLTLRFQGRVNSSGWVDDTSNADIAIWKNDMSGVLANPVSLYTQANLNTTDFDAEMTLSAAGLAATAADWDIALFRFNMNRSSVMGVDPIQTIIYRVNLAGTYAATASPSLVFPPKIRPFRHLLTR